MAQQIALNRHRAARAGCKGSSFHYPAMAKRSLRTKKVLSVGKDRRIMLQ